MADTPPKIKASPVHTTMLRSPNRGWNISKNENTNVSIPAVSSHPQLRCDKPAFAVPDR